MIRRAAAVFALTLLGSAPALGEPTPGGSPGGTTQAPAPLLQPIFPVPRPRVTVSFPPANTILARTPVTFSGTCGVAGWPVLSCGGPLAIATTCAANKTWSATVDPTPLAEGAFTACLSQGSGPQTSWPGVKAIDRIAVVMLDYLQDGLIQSNAAVEAGMFTNPFSIKNYMTQASRGVVSLDGQVFGPFVPPPLAPPGQGWVSCWPFPDEEVPELLLHNGVAYVTLLGFDKYLYIVHAAPNPECAAANSGYGPINLPTSAGTLVASVSRARNDAGVFYGGPVFDQTTNSSVAHELTHSMGISFHANALDCGGVMLSDVPGACTIGSYGHHYSIMGLRSQGTRPSPPEQELLGWLPASNIQQVTSSGQYTLYAYATAAPAGTTQTIKVPLVTPIPVNTAGGGTLLLTHLYLEYRQWTAYGDIDFRQPWQHSIPLTVGGPHVIPDGNGIIVTAASCTTGICYPYLLTANPIANPQYIPNFSADAYLRIANGWFDVPSNTTSIRVLQVNSGGPTPNVVVDIQY